MDIIKQYTEAMVETNLAIFANSKKNTDILCGMGSVKNDNILYKFSPPI